MNPPTTGIRSWAEVRLSAIRHNAAFASQVSGKKVLAVVKADAYGHGAVPVARALAEERCVDGFAVANLDEAAELREAGIQKSILILSVVLPEERERAVDLAVEVTVSTEEEAHAWSAIGVARAEKIPVHWAVDTGMGRTGFLFQEWQEPLISRLVALPGIRHAGFGSHFPSSDEDRDFTLAQINRFQTALRRARDSGLEPERVHLANSAGTTGFYVELRAFCTHVRAGLILYGVDPLRPESLEIQTTLHWKCRVSLVRDMPADHGICYGRTYITRGITRVATLTAGYADGLLRAISNRGASVRIGEFSCPILGRVTMDQIVVDVTNLPSPPSPGDEAVIVGDRNTAESVERLAGVAGTIPWEIFTNISRRVKRFHFR